MNRCLIIDYIHPRLFEILSEANIEVDYQPEISRSEIIRILPSYQALVVRGKTQIDREILEQGTQLKVVGRAGAGLDILDVDYLKSNGIAIASSPEANRDAVGDQTLSMLLAMLTRLVPADREVRSWSWRREENRARELDALTVGIIGYGNMGRAFARRLRGFECKVLVFDKYKEGFGDDFVKEVGMEELYRESDVLSLHIPLTSETNAMVNEQFLNRFSKDIYLINTARGQIAPMKGIVDALKSGKLLGAALDVLENEKFETFTDDQRAHFEYLANSDRTLLTPHVGGWSFESYEKISIILGQKIAKVLSN